MRWSEHAPNSPAWIWYVTGVARNKVNVYMHPRLTAGHADVYPNVVAVGREAALKMTLRFSEELEDGQLLVFRHVKEARNVTPWDDENVATTQRIVVVPYIRERVLQYDIGGSTQLAA